jgi:hypothetical protein
MTGVRELAQRVGCVVFGVAAGTRQPTRLRTLDQSQVPLPRPSGWVAPAVRRLRSGPPDIARTVT